MSEYAKGVAYTEDDLLALPEEYYLSKAAFARLRDRIQYNISTLNLDYLWDARD